MKTHKLSFIFLFFGFLSSGCVNLLPEAGPAPTKIVLEPDYTQIEKSPLKTPLSLAIGELTSAHEFNTQRVCVFKNENGIILSDYFAGLEYTNRLPKLLERALMRAHEESATFESVGLQVEQFKRDYILEGDIRAFNVIYAQEGDEVEISLNLKWLRVKGKRTIAQKTFTKRIPLNRRDVISVTKALEQTTLAILQDVTKTSREIALARK